MCNKFIECEDFCFFFTSLQHITWSESPTIRWCTHCLQCNNQPPLHFQIHWKKANIASATNLYVKPKFYVFRAKIYNSSERTNLISLGLVSHSSSHLYWTSLMRFDKGYETDITRGRVCLNSRFNSIPKQSSVVCIIYQ